MISKLPVSRKEKHSNGQRRAYHKQQHEISKLRATHDAQHQRRQTIQTEGPLKLSHFPSHGAISLEAKSRATAPQNKICQLVVSDRTGRPINDDTLRRHFALELERAAKANTAFIRMIE